ncbi:MAG: hypothetical protein N2595_01945 [bacterium]|nr:hypothetical protein [bacterium]
MTHEVIYVPAPPVRRRLGCLIIVALYSTTVLSLACVLAIVFLTSFARIFADVSERLMYTVLPYNLALLQPGHTPAERAAFSNAYVALTGYIAHAPSDPRGPEAFATLNILMLATRDRLITRAESAAFVSNVTSLVTPPSPPSR